MSHETPGRLHIHIAHPPPDHAMHVLKDGLEPGVEVTCGPAGTAPTTEVLVAGRPSREQLEACPNLRVLIVPYAGVPSQTRDLLLADFPDLEVYNLHHNAAAAAELAVSLLLTAAKSLVPVDRAFRQHDWRSRYDGAPTLILEGKTALILGLGAIGTRIAATCHALGMGIHAVRKRLDLPSPPHVTVHPLGELRKILPQADVLLVCLPLTPETEGLIGGHELGLLRPSSVIVNIARGAIVDEEALYRALSEGRIAAAGNERTLHPPGSRSTSSITS
jgi:phosphoglycerate dehydrogenase-like enzyme